MVKKTTKKATAKNAAKKSSAKAGKAANATKQASAAKSKAAAPKLVRAHISGTAMLLRKIHEAGQTDALAAALDKKQPYFHLTKKNVRAIRDVVHATPQLHNDPAVRNMVDGCDPDDWYKICF